MSSPLPEYLSGNILHLHHYPMGGLSLQWSGCVHAVVVYKELTLRLLTAPSLTHSPALGNIPKLICGGQTAVLIKTKNFEIELSRSSLFLGVNLGTRWRYQTYRDWTGNGLTTSDWIDRHVNGLGPHSGPGHEGETVGA